MVTLKDGKTIEVNGKEYEFKEPVFSVHIKYAEWSEKARELFGDMTQIDFVSSPKSILEYNNLWMECASVIFVNPDEALREVSIKDKGRINNFFLVGLLSLPEQSEPLKTSGDSSQPGPGGNPGSQTGGT